MRGECPESGLVSSLNDIIEAEAKQVGNVILLDVNNIIYRFGAASTIDERMFFLYKSPYTWKFMYHLASDMFKEIRGDKRYYKKALILDCDNTLWGGVVGEDGTAGIKLSPEDFPGNIFWQAQQYFISFLKRGVLLALCSKNNEEDVDEVLSSHKHCLIKKEHLVTSRVNWIPKAENIKSMAEELDLGMDSFVFIDDSDFECDAVRTALPEVMVFQVPKKISDYILMIKEISDLFPLESADGKPDKTLEYRVRMQARQESEKYGSKEDYLRSLETKVFLKKNETENIQRIAELTQKTNQFNLTTRRYSEKDIRNFMTSDDHDVFSFHVSDKFGDSGLVGICILKYKDCSAAVDTFLMSCRVIGRGVEYSIWESIFQHLIEIGVSAVSAAFIQSTKNKIVKDFFENLEFDLVSDEVSAKLYEKKLRDNMIGNNVKKQYFAEVIYSANSSRKTEASHGRSA